MMSARNHDRTHKVMLLMPDLCLSIMSDTLWHLASPINSTHFEAGGAQNIADIHILQLSLIEGPFNACNIAFSFPLNTPFLLSISSSGRVRQGLFLW